MKLINKRYVKTLLILGLGVSIGFARTNKVEAVKLTREVNTHLMTLKNAVISNSSHVTELIAEIISDYCYDGDTIMHYAAAYGDTQLIQYLYDHGYDRMMEYKNDAGELPLSIAIKRGDWDMANYIQDHFAYSYYSWEVAEMAIATDDNDLFFEMTKSQNFKLNDNMFKLAVEKRNKVVLKWLKENESDFKYDGDGNEWNDLIKYNGSGVDFARWYFSDDVNDNDIDDFIDTVGSVISSKDILNIIKFFVEERGLDVNFIVNWQWSYQKRWTDKEVFDISKYIVEHGADEDTKNYLLKAAADSGKENIVEYLIQNGANDLNSALRDAIVNNNNKVANVLRRHGAKDDKNMFKNTRSDSWVRECFFSHIENGNLDAVKAIVEHDMDINVKYTGSENKYKNKTALDIAMAKGERDIVTYLIEHGGKMFQTSKVTLNGYMRTYNDDLNIMQELVALGADNFTGVLCEIAKKGGNIEIAQYLVEKGADAVEARQTACTNPCPENEEIRNYLLSIAPIGIGEAAGNCCNWCCDEHNQCVSITAGVALGVGVVGCAVGPACCTIS